MGIDAQDAINVVRDFLGIGCSETRTFPVDDKDVIKKKEYCVSIKLMTSEITKYDYAHEGIQDVPKSMDHAVGLTSSGSIWVHSFVSYEHAEGLAKLYKKQFWENTSFTNRMYIPWFHHINEYWTETARDKRIMHEFKEDYV